jgi:polar amino acid transport system substrate-binding protein
VRRPRLVLATAAFAAVSALLLTACGGNPGSPDAVVLPDDDSSVSSSGIVKVDSIAALVPTEIASRGTLIVGSDTSYAPAEYLDDDGITPVGYDVDIAKAIALVLGLTADVRTADFSSIIPGVGPTYDVGISSFTINAERMEQVNMVQYLEAGEAFAVGKGNPQGISADDLCGTTVAVQAGTIQEEELDTLTEECESAGKKAIRTLSFDTQTEATNALVVGTADLAYADSPIIAYAIQTSDRLEQLGEAFAVAPQGIAVSKDDQELTVAIQKAVQELIDTGGYGRVLTSWSVRASVVAEAELNPSTP